MQMKRTLIAALVVMTAFSSGVSAAHAQSVDQAPVSAAVTLAIIGLHVYADQVHAPFIGAVTQDARDPTAPSLQAYYAALVARGWLDLKNYSLPDTFLYASSLTTMNFFQQLKQILGHAPNTSFSRTVVVRDGQGTLLATVLTKITLTSTKANDGDDEDDDAGQVASTDTIAVTFTSADRSRLALTYSERLMRSGAVVAEGHLKALSGNQLVAVALAIEGKVESTTGARLLRIATNAATRKTYNAAGTLVDSVASEHTGSYTVQDVAAWSYHDGMVANERNSLANLVGGVCPKP